MTDIIELIRAKRDCRAHSPQDIAWLVENLSSMADYQLAAWLMAVVCRGMTRDETVAITGCMARSGDQLDLSDVPGPRLDKHSTGGVGDKVSLVLAPLVAACGATMAKLSGRGLGHTGGTIDKLESIKGFRTDLTPEQFKSQLRAIQVAIAGQNARLAPADGRLYALRDVTGTVESLPLICASILAKKIAAGADTIVLDVKCGSGAFMRTEAEAYELAEMLRDVGGQLGRRVVCLISEMGQPLGCAVGNALEVEEALATLAGLGPPDLRDLCIALGILLLVASGLAPDQASARARLERALASGSALSKFKDLVAAQGGDLRMVEDPSLLPTAPARKTLQASQAGFVSAIDARSVGLVTGALGAGRKHKGESVDLGAGAILFKKVGDPVERGEPLAELRCSQASRLEPALALMERAYTFCDQRPSPPTLIRAVVGAPTAELQGLF